MASARDWDDAFGAPLQHYDPDLRQCEPRRASHSPTGPTTNDHDVEFLIHGDYSYSAAKTRPTGRQRNG